MTETISTERLEELAKGYETWGKTNSAQPQIDLDTASALRELLASRTHTEPVNEPAEWQVEAAARAFDPHAFKSWQQSYDYEMGQSGNADEAKSFADWSMGKRIEEVRNAARAALRAASIPKVEPKPVVTDARVREGARGIWDAGAIGLPFEAAPESVVDGLLKQSRACLTAALQTEQESGE